LPTLLGKLVKEKKMENQELFEKLREVSEIAMFNEGIRQACLQVLMVTQPEDPNELLELLFNLCAEAISNSVSLTAEVFLGKDAVNEIVSELQEKELQEMIQNYLE